MATKDRDRIRRLREEANQLRKQEEARKRRSRLMTQIGIVVGALVVVGLIATLVIMGPRWFGNQVTPEASGEVSVTTTEGEEKKVPISVGENGVTVGQPDAPNTIDYYFDFSCPHCLDYHKVMDPLYKDVIASGEAKVNYHSIRYVAEYGQYAASALYSAISTDPSKYYQLVDTLFDIPAQTQMQFQRESYVEVVKGEGFTDEAVAESVKKGEYSWFVSDATEKARVSGVKGTPAVSVNGKLYETLPYDKKTLEQALKGEEITPPTQQEGGAKDPVASETPKAE